MTNLGKFTNMRGAVWFIALFLILGSFAGLGMGKVKAAGNPTILSATTGDANHNGKIDKYTIIFSANMTQSVTSTAGFAAAGYSIGETGAWSNATTFVLPITEGTPYDTDAKPDLTYNASLGGMKDLSDNVLNNVSSGAISEVDGAGPVLLKENTTGFSRYVRFLAKPY